MALCETEHSQRPFFCGDGYSMILDAYMRIHYNSFKKSGFVVF
jgi:hypothetical protein